MNQIEKNLRMYRFWSRASEHFGLWITLLIVIVIGSCIPANVSIQKCVMAVVSVPLITAWFHTDKALYKKVKEYERLRFENM